MPTNEIMLSETVITTKKIEYVNITDDIIIYRVTAETKKNQEDLGSHVTEGITSLKNLDSLKNGLTPRYSSELTAAVGTKSFLEEVRDFGWHRDSIYELIDEAAKYPLAKYELGCVTPDDIVFIENSSHHMYDSKMQPLPVAMRFGYIQGLMDNTRYDLEKALTILKARADVRFENEDRWVDDPASILSIPGYNCDGKRNRYISFTWTPEVDDYRAMIARTLVIGGKYPSTNKHQAAFEIDVFGLRAGGAAKYDTYYGSDRETYEENEEEYDD